MWVDVISITLHYIIREMYERQVIINVSKELREQIKTLKRELTYEQFIFELVKKNSELPQTQSVKTPKRSNKGSKLKWVAL